MKFTLKTTMLVRIKIIMIGINQKSVANIQTIIYICLDVTD